MWDKARIAREFNVQLGVRPTHIWMSTGISNWVPDFMKDTTGNLRAAIDQRQARNASGAYFWTADKENTIAKYFAQGADGVITNAVRQAKSALTRFGAERRLADIDDNPFEHRAVVHERSTRHMQQRWCALHPWGLYYCAKSCKTATDDDWCWTGHRCADIDLSNPDHSMCQPGRIPEGADRCWKNSQNDQCW